MSACDANTRFQLTLAMLGSVIFIVVIVLVLAAIGKPIPEFVSGVVLASFVIMLKDAYSSYFKAREDAQAARIATQG